MTDFETTAAVEPARRPTGLTAMIERQVDEVARALPSHLQHNAPAYVRALLTVVKQVPKLRECEPATVLGGLMTAAQLGLEFGPLGHCYLVPRKGKAVFILGYKGIVDLAWRSDKIASIEARTVRDGDEFNFVYGLKPTLYHRPALHDAKHPPGIAWYGIARYGNGGSYAAVVDRATVEKHRAASENADGQYSPWRNHYDEMAQKTVVRVMQPYLPLTAEIARQLSFDGAVARGSSVETLEHEEPDYIDVEAADD